MQTLLIVVLAVALASTIAFLGGKHMAYQEMKAVMKDSKKNDLTESEKDMVRQIINMMTYMGPNETVERSSNED